MSLHKLTVGDGYTYLTRQVAAADATHHGHASLGDFYAAKGESPGVWIGSGLSGLDGVEAGGYVSAEQMKALFGEGRHPNADTIGAAMIAAGHSPAQALRASKLGRAFHSYKETPPFRIEVARRFARHNQSLGARRNAPIAAAVRARIRTGVGTEMFVDWHGRPPLGARELSGFIAESSRKAMTAVAGYDLTFSPVKSVSALWAVAPAGVAAQIQDAQQAAVADTLGWLEREAAFTRAGTDGVRQIEVNGLIAAAFTHRDARSGDPQLHTHVAISNKVQTLDGAWMALHSRVLFKARVAACERYNTRMEAELIARLGVRFEARTPADTSKRPVREIVGVDPALNVFWSSRRAAIVIRRDELSAAFQVDHDRTPTTIELERLAQQANLQTRPAKHSLRSYADQRATWWAQAQNVLGGDGAVAAMIVAATWSRQPLGTVTGQSVTGQWVGEAAALVVARVSVSRPTWQAWHVRAEAERAARTAGVVLADLDGAVDQVVARAMSSTLAVPLDRPEPVTDPNVARRRDGSSVYTRSGATRFSSRAVIESRAHLVTAAGRPNGSAAAAGRLEVAPVESAATGFTLNLPPAPLAAEMATTGARPEQAIAPAGPGKTTGTPTGSNKEPSREKAANDFGVDDEALFHAARQRECAPAPDLDAFDTERQLVEANRWDHAPVLRARLVELNEMAAEFFITGYPGSWGPQYLSGRLGTDLADHAGFRPGYAPAGWTALTQHLRGLGAGDEEILAAGLARVASTGGIVDQFRGRLVLPIHNGEAIHGFIGRRNPAPADHGRAGPKYLNTPATDLFDKSAQLFGLQEGRAALEAGAIPVLVEGFFDAIAVTLAAGGHYVGLASLGTSITAAQVNALRPYIGAQRPGVTVATDADLAGEIAAQRAFWMLAARGDTPRHVLLGGGQDPAEVLARRGPMVLRSYLDDAQPLARHLLDERLNHFGDNPQVLAECAAIIAAQPPHTWVEQIDYAAARTKPGRGALQQAVADAAQRWTLDPLGCAQSQISDLSVVRTRLQQGAHVRSAVGSANLDLATGAAANRRVQGVPSGVTSPDYATASRTTTQEPPPLDTWLQLAYCVNPGLTAGEDWPLLSRAIQEADTAGYDVASELTGLAAGGKLSTDHPATDLAYRLRGVTQMIFNDGEPTLDPIPRRAAVKPPARPDLNTSPSQRRPSRPVR